MEFYQNPVLRGFNPDPSICRVGDDFYLVTSTFEYFPGVPLYHSKNLVNWQLMGHCLTTPRQLPLEGCGASGGIYAPTIRFYKGMFYMTTTNVTSIRNFIVHSADPAKGWSNPVQVEQTGIDPSLFFDEDGAVYYTSTGQDEQGRSAIQMCRIDPLTGQRRSESRIISYGCGGCYPEGPHLFKRNGYYYLVLAEGGTEYGHHATLQRSFNPWGPFENSPHNPLLYHQNLLGKTSIQAVGHADFVEDQNGNWWLVCLGTRQLPYGLLHNLGRETFLAPVIWGEDGWPVAGENGQIKPEMNGPLPAPALPCPTRFFDDFSANALKPHWTFLRNPSPECATLNASRQGIVLQGERSLSEPCCSPAFMGVRQQAHAMEVKTKLSGPLAAGQRAGLCAYYSNNYHYEIYLENSGGEYFVAVNRRIHDLEAQVFWAPVAYTGSLCLCIRSDPRAYHFLYESGPGLFTEACQGSVAGLCTEGTEGITFTGTFVGLFTTGGKAHFDWFEMNEL